MGVVYRDDSEVIEWRERDPLPLFEARLQEIGALSEDEAAGVRREVMEEVQEAIAFAEASPFPEPAALLEDVYTTVAN